MPQYDFEVYPRNKQKKERCLAYRFFWPERPLIGETITLSGKRQNSGVAVQSKVFDVDHRHGQNTIVIKCRVSVQAGFELLRSEGWTLLEKKI